MSDKRAIINELEALARENCRLKGRVFTPYSESFKQALERESLATLKADLRAAQRRAKDSIM